MISIFESNSIALGAINYFRNKEPGFIRSAITPRITSVAGSLAKTPGRLTYSTGKGLLKSDDVKGAIGIGLGAYALRRLNQKRRKEEEENNLPLSQRPKVPLKKYQGKDTSSIRSLREINDLGPGQNLQLSQSQDKIPPNPASIARKSRPTDQKYDNTILNNIKSQQIHARRKLPNKADVKPPRGLGKLYA